VAQHRVEASLKKANTCILSKWNTYCKLTGPLLTVSVEALKQGHVGVGIVQSYLQGQQLQQHTMQDGLN
jgi:hypothetical protein